MSDFRIRKTASFTAACLLLPTLLAVVYFAFLAHPVFETNVRFVPVPEHSADGAEAVAILEAFLFSPDFIEAADRKLGLRRHFSSAALDPRYGFNRDAPAERLYRFFRRQITLRRSPNANLLTLEVRAFEPEFAKSLADYLFQAARERWAEIGRHTMSPQTTSSAEHGKPEQPISLYPVSDAHVPDLPVAPRPVRGTFTVFALSALLFGIVRLVLATIRDHSV